MGITHLDTELTIKVLRELATFINRKINSEEMQTIGFSEGVMSIISKEGAFGIIVKNNIKKIEYFCNGIGIVVNTNNREDPEYELIRLIEGDVVSKVIKIKDDEFILIKKDRK